MNRPLMFINNSTILIEQLKEEMWQNYQKIKGGDFPDWYKNLNSIEKAVFKSKFKDLH